LGFNSKAKDNRQRRGPSAATGEWVPTAPPTQHSSMLQNKDVEAPPRNHEFKQKPTLAEYLYKKYESWEFENRLI